MGNCYNIDNNDKDILSDIDPLDKFSERKNHINNNNIENNINIINEQIDDLYYISKTRLKLVVKQSKNLKEGDEYIINSLGLLTNNKNKTKDGLTIFGDINVIKYINVLYLYSQIPELILFSLSKKAIQNKIMLKLDMIKL